MSTDHPGSREDDESRLGTDLDLLVIGSGVAGLSAAVRAADTHAMRVGVLTKGDLEQTATRWAQGGVAAVLAADPDSTDLHLADTLAAGAGLCDIDAVRVLVDEGPERVNALIALGAMFDRDEQGHLELAREGGHSLARIVHAGGTATGAEIERALVAAVKRTATVIHERAFALDLVVSGGRCRGVRSMNADGTVVEVGARNVLLATGGAGQLFAVTTNPIESTGDGIAMALRSGIAVADTEFVQFHPTALHHPRAPRPLLSEALRGHGALLRDVNGERFVDELLPRDEVSRAMTRRMLDLEVEHCLLDATGLEHFAQRFPTLAHDLAELNIDPTVDLLPIAPAAHYLCGGVLTDLDGCASLDGLWAAGEAACSGVHGANRLASNSLLEGMVFGFRVVESIERGKTTAEPSGAMKALIASAAAEDSLGMPVIGGRRVDAWRPPAPVAVAKSTAPGDARDDLSSLQQAMTAGAGVLRSAESLAETAELVAALRAGRDRVLTNPEAELVNLLDTASALLAAATARQESRGAHTRFDFPDTEPSFRCRLILQG